MTPFCAIATINETSGCAALIRALLPAWRLESHPSCVADG